MNEGFSTVVASGQGNAAQLLRAVAEQLKVPLTTIARETELAGRTGGVAFPDTDTVTSLATQHTLASIAVQSDIALRLVDGYLLGLNIAEGQQALDFEPVSLAALMTDTAQELHALARQHEVQLEVQLSGKFAPVMAHAQGVRMALLSLGYGLVEASGACGNTRLSLAVHRTSRGVTAGLYGAFEALGAAEWRRAITQIGLSQRPMPGLAATTGAGLFVAETLFAAMSTGLRVGRFRKQSGLAATFQASQQLRLV